MSTNQQQIGEDVPPPKLIWHRSPNESRESYDAFWVYLCMEADRSYSRVARQVKKSPQLIHRWGRHHNWQRRSYFYDVEQDRIRQANHEDELRRMDARHADIAKAINGKCIQKLKNLDIEAMKIGELTALFRTSVEIERRARGAQSVMRLPVRRMPDEDDEDGKTA